MICILQLGLPKKKPKTKLYPDIKTGDRAYWSIRASGGASIHESRIPFSNVQNNHNDDSYNWLGEKRLADYNIKSANFFLCPRVYPEGYHLLQSVTTVELLFQSIKRSIYDDELKFTDKAKDMLAGYALQVTSRSVR